MGRACSTVIYVVLTEVILPFILFTFCCIVNHVVLYCWVWWWDSDRRLGSRETVTWLWTVSRKRTWRKDWCLHFLVQSVYRPTGYTLDSRGSFTGRDKCFSLVHSVQNVFEAHQASYQMYIGRSFQKGFNQPETDQSTPSSSQIENSGAIPPLPHVSLCHGARTTLPFNLP
jgi:hypothetical protein